MRPYHSPQLHLYDRLDSLFVQQVSTVNKFETEYRTDAQSFAVVIPRSPKSQGLSLVPDDQLGRSSHHVNREYRSLPLLALARSLSASSPAFSHSQHKPERQDHQRYTTDEQAIDLIRSNDGYRSEVINRYEQEERKSE